MSTTLHAPPGPTPRRGGLAGQGDSDVRAKALLVALTLALLATSAAPLTAHSPTAASAAHLRSRKLLPGESPHSGSADPRSAPKKEATSTRWTRAETSVLSNGNPTAIRSRLRLGNRSRRCQRNRQRRRRVPPDHRRGHHQAALSSMEGLPVKGPSSPAPVSPLTAGSSQSAQAKSNFPRPPPLPAPGFHSPSPQVQATSPPTRSKSSPSRLSAANSS